MPPSTYTPTQAINLVQQFAHGLPITGVEANICDMINSMIWNHYPWSWTVQSLTATNLTNGVQDYTITGSWITIPITLTAGGTTGNNFGGGYPIKLTPNGLSESGTTVTVTTNYAHNIPVGSVPAIGLVCTINGAAVAGYNTSLTITSIPSTTTIVGTIGTSGLAASGSPGTNNIGRPLKFRICRLDTVPNEFRELSSLSALSPELTRQAGIDTMKAFGWFQSSDFFRFDSAVSIGTGQILQLQGEYQANPTRITDATMATAFTFPDTYFNIFVEGVKWKIYQLSDDPRAGGVQMSKNGKFQQVYSGQLGLFMNQLNQMARYEDLNAGDQFQFPETGFGGGHQFSPGLYGI